MIEALGPPGEQALVRFVQAGFLFRSTEIGSAMNQSATVLSAPLGETPPLVDFAGGVLASTAFVGAIDLTAAALYRLFFGEVDPNDPGKEADLSKSNFPNWQALPLRARGWVQDTRGDNGWVVLKGVRDQFVHRWFPIHITIQIGASSFLQEVEIAGVKRSLGDFMTTSRGFVIDRLVEAGLLMDDHAQEIKNATP